MSYTIKENISKYYKAFDVCNAPHNKAELMPFVEMFLNILEISLQQLLETMEEKKYKWNYYCQRIGSLPNAEKNDIAHLYELLIQAALCSNIGISCEELLNEMKLSENTLRSRLRMIPDNLLIENRQKGKKYYLLDLDAVDIIFED